MAHATTPAEDAALSLAMAMVASSAGPLLLLDGDLNIIAASDTFFDAFQIDPTQAVGRAFSDLGEGEEPAATATSPSKRRRRLG